MIHSVIRRSPSVASSTVADPSKVTVRIENASASVIDVQDVSTSSSSSDFDDDDDDRRRKQRSSNRSSSSAASRRRTSDRGQHKPNSRHPTRPSRLSTDPANSMRLPQSRPITAVSLPGKTSAYDNEWDLESEPASLTSNHRRNPSCPSISPTHGRSKQSSPVLPKFAHQPAPNIFTTTAQYLGDDSQARMRRDLSKRSQSLIRKSISLSDPSSPTIPLVLLTDDILLGSIRALQNERQLCKLEIDYLIDATNMRPDEVARKANVGARLPCHCGHTHSRCTLTLEFDQPYIAPSSSLLSAPSATGDSNYSNGNRIREWNRTQLGQLISAVNRFILKAQNETKRILIYGFDLTPNSPLAVVAIQYLMLVNDQLSLAEATRIVHGLFPVLPSNQSQIPVMDRRSQDYLKQLEKKTYRKTLGLAGVSGDGGSTSSGNENRLSSRDISCETSEIATDNDISLTSWTTVPEPIVHDPSSRTYSSVSIRSAWDN